MIDVGRYFAAFTALSIFKGLLMIKNGRFFKMFLSAILFFTCSRAEIAPGNSVFLEDMSVAISAHDSESIRKLLDLHGSLTKAEWPYLSALAKEEIRSLKADLDGLELECVNLYYVIASLLVIPLSGYLMYKQIPRLTGHMIERDNRGCTYCGATVLCAVALLGLIKGADIGFSELMKALTDTLFRMKLTKEDLELQLQKMGDILSLINSAQKKGRVEQLS